MSDLHPSIENAPYRSLRHGSWTIQGYSRALVQSCWRIVELDLGFDLGAVPWAFLDTPTWFISHGHLDHLAGLPVLVSRRNLKDMPRQTTIYLPDAIVDDVRDMLDVWERLDRGAQGCTLNGLEPGDEVSLSAQHIVTAFATTHTVPSLGYVVWERRQKLKEEFQNLSGEQIRDLRQSGRAVTAEVRVPMLVYTGDTSPPGLDANPICYEARILITEMSFCRPNHPREKIHTYGHMHIDDFRERSELFRNELVIVGHLSSRYDPEEARQAIAETLPPELQRRLVLWV